MFPKTTQFLIVDDSSSVRALIKALLESQGFSRILEAANGKEAIERLDRCYKNKAEVNLLIVDWKMPDMDGMELLLNLKNCKKYKNIPFLMIAADNDMENVVRAVSLGAIDFLIKPFDEERFSEMLVSIWNRIHSKENQKERKK